LTDDHMSNVKGLLAICVIWWKFKFLILRLSAQFGAVIVSVLLLRTMSEACCALLWEYFSFPGS